MRLALVSGEGTAPRGAGGPPETSRGLLRGLGVVALVVLLAGCTRAALEESSSLGGGTAAAPLGGAPLAVAFTLPENAPSERLDATLALGATWLKPLEPVEARADAKASSYSWYGALLGARTHVTYVRDVPYLMDADTPADRRGFGSGGRQGATAPTARIDTGLLAPGAAPLSIAFPVEGRFALAGRDGGGGSLNVTVRADALAVEAFVRIVERGAALAFEPDEVEIPRDGRVTVLNAADRSAGAVLVQTLVPLDITTATTLAAPVDEGTYELVAIARDGSRGRGVASARFVSDYERPASRERIGPYAGELACPEPCDATRAYAFDATHDVRLASLNLTLGELVPSTVRVTVERNGETLAEATLDDDGSLRVEAIPAGKLTLRVHLETGAFASYHITGAMLYALPDPPGLG